MKKLFRRCNDIQENSRQTLEWAKVMLKGCSKNTCIAVVLDGECFKRLLKKYDDELFNARCVNAEAEEQRVVLAGQLAQLHASIGRDEQEEDALVSEKDALISEKEALVLEKDVLVLENEQLVLEKDALISEKEALMSENEQLVSEKDTLMSEKDALISEKEALMSEMDALEADNVELHGQLHEQRALDDRLQEKVQALADDVQCLQEQLVELNVRCAEFQEEVEVKDGEINKLHTSIEQKEIDFKQLCAVKNQQRDALDVSKSEAKPEAVVQNVRGPALLASKRRSEEQDDDGEITFICTVKRSKLSETTPVNAAAAAVSPLNSSKSSETTPVNAAAVAPPLNSSKSSETTPVNAAAAAPPLNSSKSSETTPVNAAAAAPPLNGSNSATIDQTQMPLPWCTDMLEQFWHVVKQNERAMLCGWTNASALVDQFMLSHTPCIEQPQHKQAQLRAHLLQFALSIFEHVQREKSLPPCPYKK